MTYPVILKPRKRPPPQKKDLINDILTRRKFCYTCKLNSKIILDNPLFRPMNKCCHICKLNFKMNHENLVNFAAVFTSFFFFFFFFGGGKIRSVVLFFRMIFFLKPVTITRTDCYFDLYPFDRIITPTPRIGQYILFIFTDKGQRLMCFVMALLKTIPL